LIYSPLKRHDCHRITRLRLGRKKQKERGELSTGVNCYSWIISRRRLRCNSQISCSLFYQIVQKTCYCLHVWPDSS